MLYRNADVLYLENHFKKLVQNFYQCKVPSKEAKRQDQPIK